MAPTMLGACSATHPQDHPDHLQQGGSMLVSSISALALHLAHLLTTGAVCLMVSRRDGKFGRKLH